MIYYLKIRKLFNKLFERLDQQGIIKLEKKFTQKSLNPFFSGCQVIIQPEVKRNILSEILDVINNNKEPSESTVLLITLINAKGDFHIFPKESRQIFIERVEEFCRKDLSFFSEVLGEISALIGMKIGMRVASL